jgi:hypothetical protein
MTTGREHDELKPGEDYSWIKPLERLDIVDGRLVATLSQVDETHARDVVVDGKILSGEDIRIAITKRRVFVCPVGTPIATWNVNHGPQELIRKVFDKAKFGELFYHGDGARGGHCAPYQVYAEVKK